MASSLSVELPVVFGSCYGNFLDGAEECAKCSFAAECAQYCIEHGIAMSEDFNKKRREISHPLGGVMNRRPSPD